MDICLMRQTIRNTGKSFKCHLKKIIIITSIVILGIISIGYCYDTYMADADHDGVYDSEGLLTTVYDMIDDIVGTEKDENGKTLNENIAENLQVDLSTNDAGESKLNIGGYDVSNVAGIVNYIGGFVTVLAMLISLIYFCISWINIDKSSAGFGELISKFLMLALTIVLIFYARELCMKVATMGSNMAEIVAESVNESTNNNNVADPIKSIKNRIYMECITDPEEGGWFDEIGASLSNLFSPIGYVFKFLIPWIAAKIVRILIIATCWSRAIEILVYCTFSPIAFSEIMDRNRIGQGSGARFMKNFAAIAISGAIIMFIMILCGNISLAVINNAMSSGDVAAAIGDTAFIAVAEGSMVLKAQSLAKTICGCG